MASVQVTASPLTPVSKPTRLCYDALYVDHMGGGPNLMPQGTHVGNNGSAKMIRRAVAAEMIGVSERTLYRWQRIGIGPPIINVTTGTARYRLADVENWIRSQDGG